VSRRRRQQPWPRPAPPRLALPLDELEAIVERTKTAALGAADYATLKAAMDTLAFLTAELQAKGTSLDHLRRLLFGPKTEKTRTIVGPGASGRPQAGAEVGAPRPGHGRLGAAAYTGADRVEVAHPTLHTGDRCPECITGKVYPLADPATLVRITGMAPLGATVYACDRLRCNLCGEVFTAPAPEGVGDAKYDEAATSMVALLKYGCGVPFHRIELLQRGLGIPLPAATQWELVRDGARRVEPAWDELIRQAAQGEVVYNDDTTMKVLALTAEQRRAAAADEETDARMGVFTSGIIATRDAHHIALFFTGRQHAGENLADVLAQRAGELPPPIQMCDALATNTAGDFDTLLANCLAHSRRRFVDVVASFPAEVQHVLEILREVYHHDTLTRQRAMAPDERLRFHQTESGPLMAGLDTWLRHQLDEHRVEPNSGLGDAITYMLKHWSELTLFLRVPGAPLDNNLCERALKKAILHRKNALFYKTLNGARVGDVFMSLIHTAELNGIAPFEYLIAMQRHHRDVARNPSAWMPWTYEATLAEPHSRAGPSR
jgi:transposase